MCTRPGTICENFACSGIPSISRSHVCIDLSLDLSGRFIEIGLSAGCNCFTGVPGRSKYPVAPTSAIASLCVIYISNVEYGVSIVLSVWLFMIVFISLSSSSSSMASSANLLEVLCWVE